MTLTDRGRIRLLEGYVAVARAEIERLNEALEEANAALDAAREALDAVPPAPCHVTVHEQGHLPPLAWHIGRDTVPYGAPPPHIPRVPFP